MSTNAGCGYILNAAEQNLVQDVGATQDSAHAIILQGIGGNRVQGRLQMRKQRQQSTRPERHSENEPLVQNGKSQTMASSKVQVHGEVQALH